MVITLGLMFYYTTIAVYLTDYACLVNNLGIQGFLQFHVFVMHNNKVHLDINFGTSLDFEANSCCA